MEAKNSYLLDENIDQRIISVLSDAGIRVLILEELGMKGEKDDALILLKAKELGCVLVTQDDDLLAINKQINEQWLIDETTHAGIIFVTSPRSPGQLARQLIEIAETYQPEDFVNRLEFI